MKKKLFSIILVTAVSLSLAACGNKTADDTGTSAEETAGEEQLDDVDAERMAELNEEDQSNYTDDGYEIVDEINVDDEEVSIKYTGYEIIDDTDENDNPVRRLVVYCDFTNKMSIPLSSSYAIQTSAYQNGVELQGWGGSTINESLENEMVDIMDGATLNVAFLYDIQDEENPVKFRIENSLLCDEITIGFAQEQEISLN